MSCKFFNRDRKIFLSRIFFCYEICFDKSSLNHKAMRMRSFSEEANNRTENIFSSWLCIKLTKIYTSKTFEILIFLPHWLLSETKKLLLFFCYNTFTVIICGIIYHHHHYHLGGKPTHSPMCSNTQQKETMRQKRKEKKHYRIILNS